MKEIIRKEERCGHCDKLLGKGKVTDFEIKCPRCGTLNHMRDRNPGSELPDSPYGAYFVDSKKENG